MTHPIATAYASPEAIERLMVLIATILYHPGIGGRDPLLKDPGRHDAIAHLTTAVHSMGRTLELNLPKYSPHTIRKDLKILRQYGLLEQRMYRWGYYLGNAAFNRAELALALNALTAQTQQNGDPTIRRLQTQLERHFSAGCIDSQGLPKSLNPHLSPKDIINPS